MNRTLLAIVLPLILGSPASHARNGVRWDVEVAPSVKADLRPVKWTVVGGARARDVASGRTVPITVQADIAKGWHIYSLNQKPGGPIPLRIELVGAQDIVVRGVIKAPKPERTYDKNFGIETELYSGSPRFTIPVGVPGKATTGVRKFQVGARYQVCSDKLCLPPRTDKLDVALRIASR